MADVRPGRGRLDVASFLSLPLSVGLILAGQALEGGSVRSLFQPTAALIVCGGTLGAILMSFSLVDVLRAAAALGTVFTWDGERPNMTISTLMPYVHLAWQKGILALDGELPEVKDQFLRKALAFVVDGHPPDALRAILETENQNREEYDELPAKVFEAAGGYSPTIGILGAVLGLIQTMRHLGDPSELGTGIAVAFVATVYGVASANLLLLPMANKIRMKASEAARRHDLMIEGVLAIQERVHPQMAEERLRGFAAETVPTFEPKQAA
jgi:chemotaxis protein MotA